MGQIKNSSTVNIHFIYTNTSHRPP